MDNKIEREKNMIEKINWNIAELSNSILKMEPADVFSTVIGEENVTVEDNKYIVLNKKYIKNFLLRDLHFYPYEVSWLEDIGFFSAPASVSHHGNYKGGLLNHSLMVGIILKIYTDIFKIKWDHYYYGPCHIRVGLLHDICKTTDYKFYDPETDQIIPHNEATLKSKIVVNANQDYAGHGDKSIIMLAGNINITEQEKMCIRYHMGAFTDKSEWKYYTKACKDPAVLFTHEADMIASQIFNL